MIGNSSLQVYKKVFLLHIAERLFYGHSLLARLESAYSLNWGAHEIWGQGERETLALL